MHRKLTIVVTCLFAVGLLALVATRFQRSEPPLLIIIRTAFPSCGAFTYKITKGTLTVTEATRVLSQVVLDQAASKALTQAISNTRLSALDNAYEDGNVKDGFALEFQFNLEGNAKTVELRNRYIPQLYAILDECNKLLAPDYQFTEKQEFVRRNEELDRLLAQCKANPDVPNEHREKVIAELEKQRVKLEE